jgi:tyrosine-protein phosphatase YwqE
MRNERAKMSYVRQIFTTPKHVLVVYEGPVNPTQDKEGHFRMQMYTLNGKFLGDVPIPGHPDRKMWLDKDEYILYSLASQDRKDGGHEYFILKFIIII